MNSQDEHYQEVVKRFSKEILSDFHNQDPLFNNILYAIISGVSPYKCLEDLLRAYKSICNELTELKLNGPQPEYFVVTQETIDELKNTKVLNPTATPVRK